MPWYEIKASQYGSTIINGYAYPFIRQEVLNEWLPDLTYVSSFNYGITSSGELIPPMSDDARLLATAADQGVAPIMVLAAMDENGQFNSELASRVLRDPQARKNLTENIYQMVQSKNFYGVDFDFEYIPAEDKDLYAALVAETARRLHPEGYIVLVALAPKTYTEQPGLLYEGHDYAALGNAADLALLMTYEWGYRYGPPMAVAPLNNVRQVVEYGITQISPNKILLGIPNYGYDWTLPFVPGESAAETISNIEAPARAARYGAEIQFDETAQSPFYRYTDELGRPHIVWFEDARSIRSKLNLIEEYGLAGASIWTIMNPFPPGASEVLNDLYTVAKVE